MQNTRLNREIIITTKNQKGEKQNMNQIKFFKLQRHDTFTSLYSPNKLSDEVNTYASNNNLEILNFTMCENLNGMFVLFRENTDENK